MDNDNKEGKEASVSLINENILVSLKQTDKRRSKRHRYIICGFILCVLFFISVFICFVCFARQARPIRCGISDKILIHSLECSEPATLGKIIFIYTCIVKFFILLYSLFH